MKALVSAGIAAAAVLTISVPFAVIQASQSTNPGAGASSAPDSTVLVEEWNGGDRPLVGAAQRDRAQRLFESFAGTAAQQNALSVVRAFEANRGMDECMAAAGFPEWDWSLSRVYADPDDALKTSFWLAMPMSRWRSHDLVAQKPFLAAEAVMNRELEPDYSDAVTSCLESADSSLAYGDSAEPLVERLKQQWWSLFFQFKSAPLPDPNVYVDCMNSADIKIMEGKRPEFSEFGTEVAYAMTGASPSDANIPSDPRNPDQWTNADWQQFLALEDEFNRADWACRKDIYAEFIPYVDQAVANFAAEHAVEIERAQQYWDRVSQRAIALGYSGQVGPLEGQLPPQ